MAGIASNKLHPPRFQFDREKFKNVVHYVCASCDNQKLGNVKLHKVLYFADMLFYVQEGRPITGATYQKQQFGPTASYLTRALRELESNGAIEISDEDFYGFRKKSYKSLREPNLNRLSDAEKQHIDSMVGTICYDMTAKEISDISHGVAWSAAQIGEELPYVTALSLFPVEISDEDIEWGVEEASKIVAGTQHTGSMRS